MYMLIKGKEDFPKQEKFMWTEEIFLKTFSMIKKLYIRKT